MTSGDEDKLDGPSGDKDELDGTSRDEDELGGASGDEDELDGTSGDEGESSESGRWVGGGSSWRGMWRYDIDTSLDVDINNNRQETWGRTDY